MSKEDRIFLTLWISGLMDTPAEEDVEMIGATLKMKTVTYTERSK